MPGGAATIRYQTAAGSTGCRMPGNKREIEVFLSHLSNQRKIDGILCSGTEQWRQSGLMNLQTFNSSG
jgi:hypothetical protein